MGLCMQFPRKILPKHILSLTCFLSLASAAQAESVKAPFKYTFTSTNVLRWQDGDGPLSDRQGPMASTFEALLAKSTQTADFAVYGVDRQAWLFDAIRKARKNRLRVRAVVDQKSGLLGEWISTNFTYGQTVGLAELLWPRFLLPDIDDKGRPRASSIMHNKFVVFDNRSVWLGSANFTASCMGDEYNANVAVHVESPEVARYYDAEFNQMFAGRTFSGRKVSVRPRTPLTFSDGTKVGIYFSPADDPIGQAVIPFIEDAKETLDIGMFFLTHPDVVTALIAARQRGVMIRLITDCERSP